MTETMREVSGTVLDKCHIRSRTRLLPWVSAGMVKLSPSIEPERYLLLISRGRSVTWVDVSRRVWIDTCVGRHFAGPCKVLAGGPQP